MFDMGICGRRLRDPRICVRCRIVCVVGTWWRGYGLLCEHRSELELVVSDVVRVLTAWLTAYVPTCVCVGAAVQMFHVASLRGAEIRARRGTPGRGGGAVEMRGVRGVARASVSACVN